MARKKRKKSKRARTPRLSAAQLVQPGQAEAPVEVRKKRTVPTPSSGSADKTLPDLREEYHYVVADLKRIGIIAAAMLVVMILLAVWLV